MLALLALILITTLVCVYLKQKDLKKGLNKG